MNEFKKMLETIFEEDSFIKGVASDAKSKVEKSKIDFSYVSIKQIKMIQFVKYVNNQAFHENIEITNSIERILELSSIYNQIVIYTKNYDFQIFTKKEIKILKKKASHTFMPITHNKQKNYIILDGEKVDFLVELGVMDQNGKVNQSKYDKFKQINKYLEFIKDSVKDFGTEKNETIRIIDFGCGKGYLTFALHHFLSILLGLNVDIIGLDLKKDVMDANNKIVNKLKLKGLRFIHGDIKDFENNKKIHLVFSLHACDIATDYAIYKGVRWDASVIMAVPCCHKEINKQLRIDYIEPILKFGIHKEKFSTMLTDSLRASILNGIGYKTSVMEFIDMEHTPKNVIIKAVKYEDIEKNHRSNEYKKMIEDFKIQRFTLDELLNNWQ